MAPMVQSSCSGPAYEHMSFWRTFSITTFIMSSVKTPWRLTRKAMKSDTLSEDPRLRAHSPIHVLEYTMQWWETERKVLEILLLHGVEYQIYWFHKGHKAGPRMGLRSSDSHFHDATMWFTVKWFLIKFLQGYKSVTGQQSPFPPLMRSSNFH